jgi:hypothetical protein
VLVLNFDLSALSDGKEFEEAIRDLATIAGMCQRLTKSPSLGK